MARQVQYRDGRFGRVATELNMPGDEEVARSFGYPVISHNTGKKIIRIVPSTDAATERARRVEINKEAMRRGNRS